MLSLETNLDFFPGQCVHNHDRIALLIRFVPGATEMEDVMRFDFEPLYIFGSLRVSWPNAIPRRSLFVVIKDKSLLFDGSLNIKLQGKIRHNCVLLSDEELVDHARR